MADGSRPPRPGNLLEPNAQFGQTAPVAPNRPGRAVMPFDQGPVVTQMPSSQMPSSQMPSSQMHAAQMPGAQVIARPASGAVQLLWLDPAVGPRLRRSRQWREIIDALEDDDDLEAKEALGSAGGPADVEAARNTFEVLARAPSTPAESLRTTLMEAVRPDGKLVPPLVVIVSELLVQIDPGRRLRTAAEVVGPMAAGHAQLHTALEAILRYVDQPAAVAGGPDALTRQLFATVRASLRNIPEGHLEAVVDRLLLEQRAYETRDVFGAPHARMLLADAASAVCYLPLAAAQRTPLCSRARVRLLAELHPRTDEAEPQACALRVRAFAREIDLRSI